MKHQLFIVPTPIGNREDITLRALRILKEVEYITAEDTRTTLNLLNHYNIKNKLIPFHQHNEHKKADEIISLLKDENNVALVCDAGTPGISDAGFLLVRKCIENNIRVETLPGPSAFLPALINSGLPCEKFMFEGFLPHKKGRQTRLKELKNEKRTMIFYESPHRLLKTLKEFSEHFGSDRKICVTREISKIYEENIRGTLEEVISHFEKNPVKGEIVIVVEGKNLRKSV